MLGLAWGATHNGEPALTSVDYDAHNLGVVAARLLLGRLADPERPPVHVETTARLVVRASTGVPGRARGGNPALAGMSSQAEDTKRGGD